MRFPPPGTCALAVPLLLAGAGVTMAQTTTATPPPRATTADAVPARTDDRGFDWGWLGLIGLAGLAGLGRRERVLPTTTGGVSSRP